MANVKLGLADLGNTKLGNWATLSLFAQQVLINVKGDEVKGARRLWDAASQREDWGIELAQFFLRELNKGMSFRSGDVSERVEEKGHPMSAGNGHSTRAPSSPQPVRPLASKPAAKTDHETAGHAVDAGNGLTSSAQSSHEPVDSRGGHAVIAGNGQTVVAPSPSPRTSLLGHNKPPKEMSRPAFDPEKLVKATANNEKQVAFWYLSDGKVPYKLTLSECLIRAKDGVDCRILVEACMAKYANAVDDMSKTPEDLLTSEEISACQQKAKRLRATALEVAV
jgi:hypothetical protein